MIRSLLSLLLLLPMLLSCVTQERVQRVELIAHAGGEIDGYVYTNSLEALQQAASRGYKFIELDLLLTSDSVLVAAHSWEDFTLVLETGTGDVLDTLNGGNGIFDTFDDLHLDFGGTCPFVFAADEDRRDFHVGQQVNAEFGVKAGSDHDQHDDKCCHGNRTVDGPTAEKHYSVSLSKVTCF